ncbi:L,D-transpeptidase family protein [Hydrogenimonas sp. SS33]|uniref:L,D-transpeptidase family protein n=1 Tax=Hydrogenimonas leucolamina TaxID=2954236 RepID=UPI00336C108A
MRVFDAKGHHAVLAWYEKRGGRWVERGRIERVNIGRNGVGKEKEGDGRTPVGVYPLEDVYGYRDVETKMPFFLAADSLICVDDPRSRYYNRIVDARLVKHDFDSFEKMRRRDGLYRILVTVGYNGEREQGKGSCIFLHVADSAKATAGCVAMPLEALKRIAAWLDPAQKPVLVVEGP